MLYVVDLFSIAVFAVSGALMAGRKRMDVFGVMVLAIVTAVGGGSLRDVLLGMRPVWIADPKYIIVCIGASVVTIAGAPMYHLGQRALLIADAFGLAVATVLGVQKALGAQASPLIAVIMGIMTGVAGGMIRDVLCDEIPLVLRKEIYATASLLSGVVFLLLSGLAVGPDAAVCGGIIAGLTLRLAAIRWHLSLPVFTFGDEPAR